MGSNLYIYNGPVLEFDTCIKRCWKASTYAASKKKAISNLSYRFKKEYGKAPNTKIVLPGKLTAFLQREELD